MDRLDEKWHGINFETVADMGGGAIVETHNCINSINRGRRKGASTSGVVSFRSQISIRQPGGPYLLPPRRPC